MTSRLFSRSHSLAYSLARLLFPVSFLYDIMRSRISLVRQHIVPSLGLDIRGRGGSGSGYPGKGDTARFYL